MKRTALRRAAFALILIGLVAGFEADMRHVKTSYSKKREILATRGQDIDVLVTGASCALFGINPARLEGNAANIADVSQTLHYDRALVEKYAPALPKLRVVVLGLSLLSMEMVLPHSPEEWRAYLYERYWSIPPEGAIDRFDIRRFSVTALLPPRFRMRGLLRGDISPEVDGNGFDREDGISVTEEVAREHYGIHTKVLHQENLPKNEEELSSLLGSLRARGVRAVVLLMPAHRYYSAIFDPETRNRDKAALEQLCREYGADFHDYIDDARFADAEFRDPDHLNGRGADHFTQIIQDEILDGNAP
jgi:hypothetical protein